MSGHQPNVTTRKKRRGMIEKRRRDKINNSLCELRRLVPAAFEKQGSAKLEKAEILQMTVDYLRMLHARGLADSLTTNKHLTLQMSTSDDPVHTNQSAGLTSPNLQVLAHHQHMSQAPPSQTSSSTSSSSSTASSLSSHQSANQTALEHQQVLTSASTSLQQHQQQLDVAISNPLNSASANSAHHHHLYNQHYMSAAAVAAAEHTSVAAATYHHHLSNPLAATTAADMMAASHHSSSNHPSSHHQHHGQHQHYNHHQQQSGTALKHPSIKMEGGHNSSIVIHNSHPSLLNLDHHHHHHQAHSHSHVPHPLGAHYGSHHHHSQATHLAMNPYLAATAAAAVGYPPMSAVSVATTHLSSANTTPSIDTMQGQGTTATFDQHHQHGLPQNNSNNNNNNQQQQQQLQQQQHLTQTQLTSSSPSANDTSGHQQVSSSSSPSDSTSNTSAAAQRHYRPWGTEMAY